MPDTETTRRGGPRTICPHGYSIEAGHCDGPYIDVAVIFKTGSSHG